ncbi:MAG: hypothetical protein J6U54_09350 [Clostridiales bacterium]|nr:hypothetical protein [Clostridiales bacterium]
MRNKNVGIILIAFAVVLFAFIGIMVHLVIKTETSEASAPSTPKRQIVIDNQMPSDGQKIELTQEMVNEDMKIYFENFSTAGLSVFIIIPGVMCLVGVVCFVISLLKLIKNKREGGDPAQWVKSIFGMAFGAMFAGSTLLFIVVILINMVGKTNAAKRAQTEDAKVEKVLVLETHSSVYTDNDGISSTTYYIIIDDNSRQKSVAVSENVYNFVRSSNTEYYLAKATDGKYFAAYNANIYDFKG